MPDRPYSAVATKVPYARKVRNDTELISRIKADNLKTFNRKSELKTTVSLRTHN